MTELILNTNSNNNNPSRSSSVQKTIQKFNMLGNSNHSSSISIRLKTNTQSLSSVSSTSKSTISKYGLNVNEIEQQKNISNELLIIPRISTKKINLQSGIYINNKNRKLISIPTSTSSAIIYKELQVPSSNNQFNSIHNNSDDIGLEIIESAETRKYTTHNDETYHDFQYPSAIPEDCEENDIQQLSRDVYPPPPPPLPPIFALPNIERESNYQPKRSLPLSNFFLEIGALVVVFIICMVLVLAIREDQANLRTTMQIVYTYIYFVSIIWMIWCTFDIIKFRRQWMKLTSSAHDHEEYMNIVEHYSYSISYFPDVHNTSGLFMRIGAGLLCMGSLLLTVIELAKIIEMIRSSSKYHEKLLTNYSQPVFIAKSITFIFRFLFHCIQFTFLFRYGNIIIDRYHLTAKIGLIHIVIANFCTWFEAIVIETLEQLHKYSNAMISTNVPISFNTTRVIKTITSKSAEITTISYIPFDTINFLKISAVIAQVNESSLDILNNTSSTVLEFIEKIESTMNIYLYPCLIEYSLICVTIFYIMWRNVGKTENRSYLHFGDRHVFTVNCSRASYGLLIGGIILLLTILTLILDYILKPPSAIPITHITELILLIISLLIVFISFFYTTKLYYDRQAHIDIFDQILILVTTVGDFAYSFFGLFASIFVESYTIDIPRGVEIAIGLLAIFQTFLQSGFIIDAFKRRPITKTEIRKKPGRELITALLLINLAIWMHDSLSAKKVKLNPLQTEYYDAETWSIVQAFTSPLSIFYRFHSSVCLADIWQEVYHHHGNQHGKNQSKENK